MPTSRRKSSPCLTISPWKTVRRGSDRQQPTSESREVDAIQGEPAQSESKLQHDQNEEEFRLGIDELIKNEQLMVGRFTSELDQRGLNSGRGIGILAFERPGATFFGALLDNTLKQNIWYVTGEAIESSFQNCGHKGIGCQYYNVYISNRDGDGDERQLVSMAVNSGGDAAKLTSVDGYETMIKNEGSFMFQCLQLYIDGSEKSCFTKYFSHCSVSDGVIINIGIMEIHP